MSQQSFQGMLENAGGDFHMRWGMDYIIILQEDV